jgi:hypothetical protein
MQMEASEERKKERKKERPISSSKLFKKSLVSCAGLLGMLSGRLNISRELEPTNQLVGIEKS